ncbi:UNVERIFIED_CONTAM: G2/mitotic-specific cyclin-B3, partial [Eudyptes robustus]
VSLHFLDFCRVAPSKMAAACLLLAMRMTNAGEWNTVLLKYSGYTAEDLEALSWSLNHMLKVYRQRFPEIKMVWGKYSHEVFFEVAKTPILKDRFRADAPIGPP